LLELYLGNNRLDDLSALDSLSAPPTLIIADLAGNSLCAAVDYRLYVIYRLTRLKVLDGVSVTADDVTLAKQKFCGKLTERDVTDMMEQAAEPYSLALPNGRLRDVSVLGLMSASSTLDAVREVNLECNLLTSFAPLMSLKSLQVLRLSHNRIEALNDSSPQGLAEKPVSRLCSDVVVFVVRLLLRCNAVDESATSAALSSVEVLLLGYNKISSLESLCLARFPRLRVLHLQNNQLSDLAGLAGRTLFPPPSSEVEDPCTD
jgi:Leucine-rich repeat (LRR) protein